MQSLQDLRETVTMITIMAVELVVFLSVIHALRDSS